jgi:glycosyltransferase involved in cell wall biosynthesis
MTTPTGPSPAAQRVRLAYLVSHPIQYQAPLLRRIAQEPDIDLTVLFGSDFSVRNYRDEGFGVDVAWDTPLLDGYHHRFLKPLRDTGSLSFTSPLSRDLWQCLRQPGGRPAFDALWVHGYATLNSLQGILAAYALGIPVLLRAESWLGDRERGPARLVAKSAFFAALRPAIAAVLPIGSANVEYWARSLGPTIPQFLMPYAVDNPWFASRAAAATSTQPDLRRELNLDPHRPLILFASKLQTRKNAADLIEAYRAFIANRSPEATPYLVIVGDGEERSRLEDLCRAHNLTDVRFAGFRNQTELPRFFDLADVFVLPSRHEPWGLIVNEAMSAACPVIVSTDVGCHPDLVTSANGCVFPVGDIRALTACLQTVFATPETARSMGLAAQRRMATWSFQEDVAGLRAALAHTTRKLRPGTSDKPAAL